jgi:hypothetical protein
MDQWKTSEIVAGVGGVTAPWWVTALQELNLVLATVSSLLTIGFVLWRWSRSVRNRRGMP